MPPSAPNRPVSAVRRKNALHGPYHKQKSPLHHSGEVNLIHSHPDDRKGLFLILFYAHGGEHGSLTLMSLGKSVPSEVLSEVRNDFFPHRSRVGSSFLRKDSLQNQSRVSSSFLRKDSLQA